MKSIIPLLSLLPPAALGAILWDGRLNDMTAASDLEKWSWSNQVGPYQYYIHGPGGVDDYVALGVDFKNPADAGSDKGMRVTLDSTAYVS
jgi:hypothetical protein